MKLLDIIVSCDTTYTRLVSSHTPGHTRGPNYEFIVCICKKGEGFATYSLGKSTI